MEDLSLMTKDTIMSPTVFEDLLDLQSEVQQTRMRQMLEDRAEELGVKTRFNEMLRAYKKDLKEADKQKASVSVDQITNFNGPYSNMNCGYWIATEHGICSQKEGSLEDVACYHPILPIERLKNLETGEEQIKLAYKRNGIWRELIVPKIIITSASKIVGLSSLGVSVTSETAKLLVRYLADVENMNEDIIEVQYSTSKLGWNDKDFIPYDKTIAFDGDQRFKQVFEAIEERGDEDVWMNHIKELRKSGRSEAKILMAASFASILVKPLGGLPFFVDLWGETEGGKTVALMTAASIWANPDESRFIGDFKTTDVALEAKADMLNNLPMLLDDTSKTSARIRDNFEGVIYDLCSGKGKSRSNKDLGINRENRWKNVIICNGERPLSSYANQGGAINRILEVECSEKLFEDPRKTAETVKKNYGFAGKRFVQIVNEVGIEQIKKIQDEIFTKLSKMETGKTEKQSISLSILLTADKLATDYLFKDGQYISMADAEKLLTDKTVVSDNQRAYEYLVEKVMMNGTKFQLDSNIEQWGAINEDENMVYLFGQALSEICQKGGFSQKSLIPWLIRNNLIVQGNDGRPTKVQRIGKRTARCYCIKLPTLREDGVDEDGFRQITTEEIQEKLPFD